MDQLQRRFQEFLYVSLRVAHYVRSSHLRDRTERVIFSLLDRFIERDIEGFLEHSRMFGILIQLGLSLYEIETVNGKSLLKELDYFNAAIRQYSGLSELPEIRNLGNQKLNAAIPLKEDSAIRQQNNTSANEHESSDEQISIASTVRQSAIIEKVRSLSTRDSFGNLSGCKMRDLTSAFPNVSERTLRYDLERLLTQGTIERVGNGGPSLFYVIK